MSLRSPIAQWIDTQRQRPLVRRIVRNFSLGFAGSGFSAVLGLGRTMLLTKVLLDLEGYGTLLIVLNLFSVLEAFASIRVHEMLYKFWPRFESDRDLEALRALVVLSLGISAAVGLSLFVAVFLTADWIAVRFYSDQELALLFRLYAFAVVLISFHGLAGAVLRMEDRFASVIIPEVLSGLVTLLLLGGYAAISETYLLRTIVLIFLVGVLLRSLPPLVLAIRLAIRKTGGLLGVRWSALAASKQEITSLLFQSNLTGYLKVISSPGDIFLLGIFGSPAQVALYGIGQRLLGPVRTLLQKNMNLVLSPEILRMWSERRFGGLLRLIRSYVLTASAASVGIFALAILFADEAVLLISDPQFLPAAEVLQIMVLTTGLTLTFLPFYSLSIGMGLLHVRNLVLFGGVLPYLMFAGGGLTAMEVAIIQLIIVAMMVLFHNMYAYARLKSMDERPE